MKLMLYLYLDKNQIKLLYVKKTLLGQYENAVYEKQHQIELLSKDQIINNDLLASAVKEAITFISNPPIKDKDICLILPQRIFKFLRTEVPRDITPNSIASFIKDKVKSELSLDLDECIYDYFIQEKDTEKSVILYAMNRAEYNKYNEAFSLINLDIQAIIPDALAYFKLFEKTLRKDKKEFIFYTILEKAHVSTLFYDSYGPVMADRILDEQIKESKPVEKQLKALSTTFEEKYGKINRQVLSGEESENIRQDTFTKNVGVWTNPLKRILPEFYAEYLKLLASPTAQQISYLKYDVCIGAFIFMLENRTFSLLKKKSMSLPRKPSRKMNISIPYKEIGLFAGSFVLSFIVLMFVSKMKMPNFFKGSGPSPTPTSAVTVVTPTLTPSPTPAIDRKTVKVKVLNGSGTRGKAAEVKDIIKKAGYEEILTGNADNFDYTTSEIQVKATDKTLGETMKSDLKDYVSNPTITTIPSTETADVIVIFGKDFK